MKVGDKVKIVLLRDYYNNKIGIKNLKKRKQ